MKTAGRKNPNRCAKVASNRAFGAGGQNRPCSIEWAAKQEKFQPAEGCFFLTSTFIELTRQRTPMCVARKLISSLIERYSGKSILPLTVNAASANGADVPG